jgi:large repetitive protein
MLRATQGVSASGTRSYTVNIHAAPTISNLTVTQWTQGKSGFTGTITIANGTPLYAIVGRPTGLPPGLTAILSGNTILFTGTPSAAGKFNGGTTIKDSADAQVTKTFTIRINPSLTFMPATLPPYIPGRFYAQTIVTAGGTGSRRVSYTLSRPLPRGLTISPSPTTGAITISGTNSATTSVTITMTVTDSIGAQTTMTYQFAPRVGGSGNP